MRVNRIWLSALALLLALLLLGTGVRGQILGNAGMVALTRALLGPGDLPAEDAASAEKLLRRAVKDLPQDRALWRGLGFALATQGREAEAQIAWDATDQLADGFIWRGEMARQAERFQEALQWYERAARIEPDLGDAWYYIGLAHEGLGRWADALGAYERALLLEYRKIGPSDVYFRKGVLQFDRLEPPDSAAALAAFDAAISLDRFYRASGELWSHFQRGEVLRRLGREEDAIADYEWVIAQEPEHYRALLRLGGLYWTVEGDANRAQAMLTTAISVEPETKWAYRELGRLYQETGRDREALEMYQRVLRLDPQDDLALEELEKLDAREDD